MAKKSNTTPQNATSARIARTEAYAERVRAMFAATVNRILELNKAMPVIPDGEMFSFDAQTEKLRVEVERCLRQLHSVATAAIQQGIRLEWETANVECDKIAQSVVGKKVLENPEFGAWVKRNNSAMRAFIARSDAGMNLSQRVWQSTRQLRDEMEIAITVAVGDGTSAAQLSRNVRKYLNDPDLMFRRFRYKDPKTGEWKRKWKKRVIDPTTGKVTFIDYDKDSYRDQWTGRGYYKSAAQNAMRVARTETNIAYRRADNERWQQMDFVIGQRVQMSRNHPKKDICDKLAGDYPKDFVFDGWHAQCFCVVVPILIDEDEYFEIMSHDNWREELKRITDAQRITDYPDNFKSWVTDNANNIEAARQRGTEPYFIRNNAGAIDNILNPDTSETKRQEQRRIHIEQSEDKFASRVLDIMRDVPGVDVSALEHAIKTGNHDDAMQQATALRERGRALKSDAKDAIRTAGTFREVDSTALSDAIKSGNIKSIVSETASLQSAIDKMRQIESDIEKLIPDAHKWHESFTIAELQTTYAAVEKTFARWKWDFSTDASLQFLKNKLETEISVVAKTKYATKDIAQAAYQKRLDLINKRITMKSIGDGIASELAFAATSKSQWVKSVATDIKLMLNDNDVDLNVLRNTAATLKAKVATLQAKAAARKLKKSGASASTTSTTATPKEYDGVNVIDELNNMDEAAFRSLLRTGYRTPLGTVMCGDEDVYRKFLNYTITREEFMKAVEANFGDYGKVDFAPLPVAHVTVAAKRMNITGTQKRQIKSHSGGGYIGTSNSFKMNGCLRNKTTIDPYSKNAWTPDDDKTMADLDAVIANNKIKSNVTMFRMVDSDWLVPFVGKIDKPWLTASIEDAAKKIIGKPCPNLGYTSASFNNDLNVFGRRPVCLRIKVPKGTPMYITENYAESEAILGRNTTLMPQSITKVGNHIIIDCTIM